MKTGLLKKCIYIYLSVFGWAGCLLPHMGFLWLQWAGAILGCSARVSHCGGFSCCGTWNLDHSGISSCGTQALLPPSMWDLPGPGIKPVSPALTDEIPDPRATREVQAVCLMLAATSQPLSVAWLATRLLYLSTRGSPSPGKISWPSKLDRLPDHRSRFSFLEFPGWEAFPAHHWQG